MVVHSTCPLCDSGNISFFLKCTDNLVSGDKFDLYRCPDCNFIFTQGYPDEGEIGTFYDSADYISHEDNAHGMINSIYRKARDLMLFRKRKMIEKRTGMTKGRLLDIGCGTGHFAGMMQRSGWIVKGIEKNKKAREFGRSRFGLNIIEPEKLSTLPEKGFDCITLWHVLEHLHDPFKFAREIKRLLNPKGFVIIALPNSASSDSSYYKENWAAFDVPRHLWHFDMSTFRKFCERTGFTIVSLRRLPLDVFYISILSERNIGASFPFVKGLVKGSLFALKSLFKIPDSSSLVFFLRIPNYQ
jgi:SAM-dependent methyltransferase